MAQIPSLSSRLADPARPVFLLGDVPPGEGTPPGKCQTICNKFMARSRALASDGFIVYDIQDEPGRSDMERPFPFRRVMDSSRYGALLSRSSGKQCLIYKCVADPTFEEWVEKAAVEHGHTALNLVGRASSDGTYEGPTISEAMEITRKRAQFGCVCIAERHTLEAAEKRGKSYPTEHQNMLRKQKAGAQWFISQAVYDPEPTIRLLKDYAALCREQGIVPNKVVLTFAPVSRKKTLNFIKWLGVKVPQENETKILEAEKPINASVELCCDILKTILSECAGVGVPLGISCESVSIFKAEIDGVHELFRKLQEILLDARGTPWKVQWIDVLPFPIQNAKIEETAEEENALQPVNSQILLQASFLGALIGGSLMAVGVVLGGGRKK
mmetsp:Transcript_19891/g.29501  ORF Transcript_19891/g.29501 Transcript_19891/m.29501 type:complete len:385 (+) Transcript_19891:72-1226(+)|eukprot:CAMPEP_0194220856 /NCGR_PEP_ID=MMETSP0156-20130528/29354_1 /TAXON_ID=33649 /ORGANISM="Thalassionema nitzschioides, Strain L26-B" /LENGTH=384 /DNA_ID=CAMNT_0038951069 /DNA_START=7 /DNA_END=1161 /DNA_ORIENTATION=+